MDGRRLVGVLFVGVVVVAAAFWALALRARDAMTAEAEGRGLRELSRQEAAERVAREDLFGLPSRLPAPPRRDIERALTEATASRPLPASDVGVAALLELYAVTVRGCRGLLPEAVRAQEAVPVWVTLREVAGQGRVVAVDAFGEGQVERAFTECLLGGFGPAVFEAPAGGERSVLAQVALPR